MKQIAQALPLVLVFGLALHPACGDESDTASTQNPTVATGDPFPEACNDGAPDGYCNFQGGDPETCDCFDCVETPACSGQCNDNGTCDGTEDCTCKDCYSDACVNDGQGPGPGPGPDTTTTTSSSGGAPGTGGAPNTTTTTTSAGGAPGVGGAGGAGGV